MREPAVEKDGNGRAPCETRPSRAPRRKCRFHLGLLSDPHPSSPRDMSFVGNLSRFARKPLPGKLASIKAAVERMRLYRLLSGRDAPPGIFATRQKTYVAYRPDSDVEFGKYPELSEISKKWVTNNVLNNAGDLPRFYAFIINIRQILEDRVAGNIAELGVYKGNSAALLAYYARISRRELVLFDTFEGFDPRDLVGFDASKTNEFKDTSLARVRKLVGDEGVRFIQGRFPSSIPSGLYEMRFCFVHIDCDLYEPARAGLDFFYPRLSPGGLLVVHDYNNPYWNGVKRAVDEYCITIQERPILLGDKSGTAMIRKSMAAP